ESGGEPGDRQRGFRGGCRSPVRRRLPALRSAQSQKLAAARVDRSSAGAYCRRPRPLAGSLAPAEGAARFRREPVGLTLIARLVSAPPRRRARAERNTVRSCARTTAERTT